jgi:hypothetical protein
MKNRSARGDTPVHTFLLGPFDTLPFRVLITGISVSGVISERFFFIAGGKTTKYVLRYFFTKIAVLLSKSFYFFP